jgi:DNA-binding response OmpR family regulator
MRILVVEDDPRMRALLLQAIEEEGYSAVGAVDGEEALSFIGTHSFDALVLDWMVPKISGLELCRRLRAEQNPTPILILTARDQAQDVVAGLNTGADDYLTKPFSLDVFLARLRAVSRRGPVPQPLILRVGDLQLNTGTHTVTRADHNVALTRTEYLLLELLARNAGSIVPRERIFSSVWSGGTEIESNTLDAFVRLLRKKIEPQGSSKILRTVRGIGYMLDASPR